MTENKRRLQSLAYIGLAAAALCVLSPISVPIGDVPLSLATLAVLIAAGVLGPWKGIAAVAVYLILGCVGLPVFSGFVGGFGRLLGPTGGYLFGYIPLALIAGFCRGKGYVGKAVFMTVGTLVLYAVGSVWYCIYADVSPIAAILTCMLPYLPLDAVKIAVAAVVTGRIPKTEE